MKTDSPELTSLNRFRVSQLLLSGSMLVVALTSLIWMRNRVEGEPLPPDFEMQSIPHNIGEWFGEDVAVENDTVKALHTSAYVNRIYTNSIGQKVAFHVAAWENEKSFSWAPHHPALCYPTAGWQLVSRRRSEIELGMRKIPVELILFHKENSNLVTLHWFELGSVNFVDSTGFQLNRWQLWGQKRLPATLKFLAHTEAPSLDVGEQILREWVLVSQRKIAELRLGSEYFHLAPQKG